MEKAVINVVSNGSSTQDITHGGSWTPKVAIFQWSRANTSADTFQEHASIGYGFTDGTNQRAVATASEDNAARGDSARIQRNNCLLVTLNPSGTIETVDSVATFNSWLSNGIRINWTDQPAANFYFTVTLLGGNDITNVLVDTLSTGTGTGNVSYSSISWQADYGMLLSGGTATENSPVVAGFLSLGMATGTSGSVNQWVQSIHSVDNPATMSTRQYYSHGKVVVSHTTAVDGYATFSGFNSTGFTINIADAFPASFPIYFLIMKGGKYTVGNATEIGSVTTQTITTNVDVKAVGIFGLDLGTADTVSTGCMWTSGFGDTTSQSCEVFEDTHGVADSIVVSRHDTNQIYLNITSNATATSSTLDDEANLQSVSSTDFVLNWTNIGQARPFRYCSFGSGPLSVTGTCTLRHDIRQAFIDTNTLIYNIRQYFTDTNTFIYHVRNDVLDTNTLRYDIRYGLIDTNTIIHNIAQELIDTNTLLYNIRQEFIDTNSILYDIKNEIINSNTLKHDIRQEFIDTNTIIHNIAQELVDSNTLLYDIRNEFTDTNTILYNIRQELIDSNTFIYDIESVLSVIKSLSLLHDIRQELTDINTIKYDIRQVLIDTNTFIYKIGNILYVKLATYTANTSPGDQDFTFTPNGTDPSWTPKGAIAWWTRSTNTVNTFAEHASIGMGFTDGTTSICNAFTTEDNQANSDTAGSQSDVAFIRTLVPTGTVQAQDSNATFVQWLTNGLRINWGDAPAAAFKIHILFLGGDDLTDVHVGTFPGLTSPGIQDITDPDFVPDGVMFLFADNFTTFTPTVYTNEVFGVGAADSASTQWARYIVSEPARLTMDTWRYYSTFRCIAPAQGDIGTTVNNAAYVTALTNGFRIDWKAATAQNNEVGYIAFKGCSIAVGTATEPGSTGDQVINTACPVKAVMIVGNMNSSSGNGVVAANAMMSVGAGTSSSEMATVALHDYDNQLNSVNVARYETDSIYLSIVANATASSSTINDEASLSSVSSNGFTLNWSNIGNGEAFSYITFGEIVEKNEMEDVNTLRYAIRGGVIDTLTLKYDTMYQPVASRKIHFDIGDIPKATYIPVHNIADHTYHIDYISYLLAISKQLSLLYNIQSETIDTDTFIYNIQNEVIDTNTFIYNIQNIFTDTNTLIYNIKQDIIDTNTFIHNIQQELTDTNTLIYNIQNEVVDTNTFIYNIISQLTDINTLVYDIRNELIDPNTLIYHIRTGLTDTNTFVYDVRQQIIDINTLIYDIESIALTVSKTLTLIHNIQQELIDTNTFIYNVRNTFVDTNTFIYNIRTETIDTNTLIYDILQEFTDINTLVYNIQNELIDTNTFIYNIKNEVVDTDTLIYNIYNELIDTNTLIYNIKQDFIDTNILIYGINNEVIDTNTFIYNIRQELAKANTLMYNLLQELTDTNTLIYHVRQGLIDTNTFVYNVIQQITDINTFIYDIEGLLGVVEKVLTLIHNIQQELIDTNTIKYDVKQELTDTNTLLYNLLQEVIDTNTVLYNIIQEVVDVNTLKYNILNMFTDANTLIYNIKQGVYDTNVLIYNIISQLTDINTLVYDIRNEFTDINTFIYDVKEDVSKTNTLIYNIISQINIPSTLLYNIVSQPVLSSILRYHVRNDAINTNTLIYDIINQVINTSTLLYDIVAICTKSITIRFDIATLYNTVVMPLDISQKATLELTNLLKDIFGDKWGM